MSDSPAARRFAGIFACAYPIVAHAAVARASAPWTIAAIALLACAMLGPALLRGRLLAWIVVSVIGLTCWWLLKVATPVLLLYVPPVLVPAFLAWFFGHTLVGERTPFIAHLIALLHRGEEPPEPAVWSYARSLTRAWTIFLVALASTNLLRHSPSRKGSCSRRAFALPSQSLKSGGRCSRTSSSICWSRRSS
jgi:uncharacterized membrane protein